MGLSNNLGKLSNMITSTGSAVSMSGTLTLATTSLTGTLQFGTTSAATIGYDAGAGLMSFNIGAGAAAASPYYQFSADGSSRVTILKGGNVGIGNAAPTYLLDVSGTGNFSGALTGTTATFSSTIRSNDTNGLALGSLAGYRRLQYDSANTRFAFLRDDNGIANIEAGAATFSSSLEAGKSGSLTVGDLFVDNTNKTLYVGRQSSISGDNTIFIVRNRVNGPYFYINPSTDIAYFNNCNVGIGTTTPSYKLQLSTDSAAKPSTNTWTISSDIRVKENINPYTKGLDVLMNINPVTYDYNGKAGFSKILGNIGIIAQDVLEILPESISTYKAKLNEEDLEETELYNFNSHALTYVLINAVKEQQELITSLQSRLDKAGL